MEATRAIGLASPVARRQGFARRLLGVDLTEQLGSVDVPVLALTGSSDRVISARESERLVRLLPDARLEVFPNTGHMLPMERSDEVAALILQFADGSTVSTAPDGWNVEGDRVLGLQAVRQLARVDVAGRDRRATSLNAWLVARAWRRSRSKASSIVVCNRSQSTPLACSITTRLDSAWVSWSARTCSVLEGAVLEHADGGDVGEGLGDGESSGPRSVVEVDSRHEHPITCCAVASGRRRLTGTPPAPQLRRRSATGLAGVDGCLRQPRAEALECRPMFCLELEHLQERGLLPGRRDQMQGDATVAQHEASGIDSQQVHAPGGQGGEHVETSNSTTRLSASSTNVLVRSCSRSTSPPQPTSTVGRHSTCLRVEAEAVLHASAATLSSARSSAKARARRRARPTAIVTSSWAPTDAGGLVDDGAVLHELVELERAARVVDRQRDEELRHHAGQGHGVDALIAVKAPGWSLARLREPIEAPVTCSGKAKTALTPAASAGLSKPSHREWSAPARSISSTGRP